MMVLRNVKASGPQQQLSCGMHVVFVVAAQAITCGLLPFSQLKHSFPLFAEQHTARSAPCCTGASHLPCHFLNVTQQLQPLPVLPPVNPSLLPTPSAERILGHSSSNSAYQQPPPPAPMPAAANPAAAGGSSSGVDPSLLRSPSAAAAHAHLALANGMVSGQLPPSPLPQHKVVMPNSADKLADTGKVSLAGRLN
jgi:hypothetical protein